jgi:hypothetical protein
LSTSGARCADVNPADLCCGSPAETAGAAPQTVQPKQPIWQSFLIYRVLSIHLLVVHPFPGFILPRAIIGTPSNVIQKREKYFRYQLFLLKLCRCAMPHEHKNHPLP